MLRHLEELPGCESTNSVKDCCELGFDFCFVLSVDVLPEQGCFLVRTPIAVEDCEQLQVVGVDLLANAARWVDVVINGEGVGEDDLVEKAVKLRQSLPLLVIKLLSEHFDSHEALIPTDAFSLFDPFKESPDWCHRKGK